MIEADNAINDVLLAQDAQDAINEQEAARLAAAPPQGAGVAPPQGAAPQLADENRYAEADAAFADMEV